MYSLRFDAAHQEFLRWQMEHPGDALGPVSEAANYLFTEFDRLGVLEAQFFVKDSTFAARKKLLPDPDMRARFDAALVRAEAEARLRLAEDPQHPNSLFALTLVYGLKADSAALIEKRNMAALRYTRQASELAGQLLGVAPDYHDAYLATGIAQYIVGSMIAPVRWVLKMAGYSGNKQQGIEELRLAAEKGLFLGPFARILLAIALGLNRCDTQPSWDVLRDSGNLSSASVLFVLHEWLTKRNVAAGEYGLMAAFGPGFSAEMLLLQWA